MKTVKDVSEITGVSIRTLRYYDEQMDAAGRLYGWSLHFPLSRNGLWHMLEDLQAAYEPEREAPWYSAGEWKRIREAVMDQALSYPCLFKA